MGLEYKKDEEIDSSNKFESNIDGAIDIVKKINITQQNVSLVDKNKFKVL